jgi:hypothetical protein
MSCAKVAAACALAAVLLAGCGATTKPAAGTISPTATSEGHARLDDPRVKHLTCLREHKLPVIEVGRTWLQIGSPPAGPRVNFQPTPGAAQEAQITDREQGAEAIGSALLFPGGASDQELGVIEGCLAQGVAG